MVMLKTKSVYSPIDRAGDGLRIHTARTRGRGLKSSRYDLWMPNLGPSQKLRKKLNDEQISWRAFCQEYKAELLMLGPIDKLSHANYRNKGQKFTLRLIKLVARRSNVTIMCTCKEEESQCHRDVLKQFILRRGL